MRDKKKHQTPMFTHDECIGFYMTILLILTNDLSTRQNTLHDVTIVLTNTNDISSCT